MPVLRQLEGQVAGHIGVEGSSSVAAGIVAAVSSLGKELVEEDNRGTLAAEGIEVLVGSLERRQVVDRLQRIEGMVRELLEVWRRIVTEELVAARMCLEEGTDMATEKVAVVLWRRRLAAAAEVGRIGFHRIEKRLP